MSQVLYRKYRPQSFSEIKGQEQVIPLLIESIIKDKISHAYLFSGPRGCGKTTVARLMAKAVNCLNFKDQKDVCTVVKGNECTYCKSIDSGNNMDITEMDAASNRGIEEIRSLKDTVNFMPSFLKRKVYIIDEAHMLTKEAFNALLKTLEEPPEHVIFILATTESNKLPITILSRVTRFDFKFGEQNEIIEKLNYIVQQEDIHIDTEGLEMIYRCSGGSFRDAESLLGKIILTNSNGQTITSESVRSSLGIVSNIEIMELINLMKKGNSTGLKEVLNKIFVNDSNPMLVIDQILEKIKEELYASIDDISSIDVLNLIASKLIKAKGEAREFYDKKLILEIEFYGICKEIKEREDKLISSIKPTNIQQQTVYEVKEEKGNDSSAIFIEDSYKKEVINSSIDISDNSSVLQGVIEASKQTLPRLVPILKGSQINIKNDTLTISNPYKFNITYLTKKEVTEHIKGIVLNLLNKKYELIFVTSENTIIPLDLVHTDNEIKEPLINLDKSIIKREIKKEEKKKELKKEELIEDNSDMVESILLS